MIRKGSDTDYGIVQAWVNPNRYFNPNEIEIGMINIENSIWIGLKIWLGFIRIVFLHSKNRLLAVK